MPEIKSNSKTEKVIIKDLQIETSLKKFTEEWNYEYKEIKNDLEEDDYYDDGTIMIYEEEKCYYVTFSTGDFEIINKINDIYNNKYLMIVKDILRGRNWDYTMFEVIGAEDFAESKILKGGEYKEKFRLLPSEYNEKEMYDEPNYEYKYQEFYFEKVENFDFENWLSDWLGSDKNAWNLIKKKRKL